MRAHQIMTRKVITVKAETPILEAANLMLQHHISGLPVVDNTGRLIGIVSEGDFMRRSEIGTQGPRIRWLDFLMGAGKSAVDFVREHGRKVSDIMTRDALFTATEDMPLEELVGLMERQDVKRLPAVRGDALVGMVTRSDLLRALASLARDIPDPTADDDHIRSRVIASIEKNEWQPAQLGGHGAGWNCASERYDHRRALSGSGDRGGRKCLRRQTRTRSSLSIRRHVRAFVPVDRR